MLHRLLAISIMLAPAIGLATPLTVPPVKDLPYDEAKQALISAGWTAAKDIKQDANDIYAQTLAKGNGFTEVAECTGSGLLQCQFIFVDPKTSSRIRVIALGEGMPRVSAVETVDAKLVEQQAPPTNVIGSFFASLPQNSKLLFDNMTNMQARYLYFLTKQNPDQFDQQANRFCYSQALNAADQNAEMTELMRRSGAQSSDVIRSMLDSANEKKAWFVSHNRPSDALLVDVATSGMMFAAYGLVSGDKYTSLVTQGCQNAVARAKSEAKKPSSDLAYDSN